MKHFVRIAFLILFLSIDYIYAACLIRHCLSTEKDSEFIAENENTSDKRNRNLPHDITIRLNNRKIESYRKYIDAKSESTRWTLETTTKNDPFVSVRYAGIKNSNDTRPITWQYWEIEGKSAGLSILIFRKFVGDKQMEEEKINVTVVG